MRGREGQVWRIKGWTERDLHLVVTDDGRTFKGAAGGLPVVIIMCLETGKLDYEFRKHLDDPEETGWERFA